MSDAGYSMLGAGAWGWPREMLWGGRWEGGSCLGTHVRIKDFKIKKKKTQHSKNKDHGILFHHFKANRWGGNGNSERLYFGGSKIIADGACSHEIKRCLLLGRKPVTNLDSILKSKDITLPTKVCLVKAMVFPLVMYGYEIWTIKKAEHQRIDAFELWFWRRLLRVSWTARRSNL